MFTNYDVRNWKSEFKSCPGTFRLHFCPLCLYKRSNARDADNRNRSRGKAALHCARAHWYWHWSRECHIQILDPDLGLFLRAYSIHIHFPKHQTLPNIGCREQPGMSNLSFITKNILSKNPRFLSTEETQSLKSRIFHTAALGGRGEPVILLALPLRPSGLVSVTTLGIIFPALQV